MARVWALLDHMISYMERQVFPGGCFFACTSFEFNNRPGAVRDANPEEHARPGSRTSGTRSSRRRKQGELDPRACQAARSAFQLDAFAQAANAQFQLFRDRRVFDYARRAVRERLESIRP